MNPEQFCHEAAAPPGSNFHYATLFHAPEQRRALFAVFALRAEILRIGTGTPDAGVMAMRRSWWADELARVAARQARHPVGMELQRLAERVDIDIPSLQYFAVTGGAIPDPIDRAGAPRGSSSGAGGAIWGTAARACGVRDARAVGTAIGTGELVDAVEAVACGRMAGVDRAATSSLVHELRTELESGSRELVVHGARSAEFCLIMAGLSIALCAEIERDIQGLETARVALTPLRKLWIAWRIHRRAAA